MTGRIKKKYILDDFSNLSDRQSEVLICPLCDRALQKSQRDEHHRRINLTLGKFFTVMLNQTHKPSIATIGAGIAGLCCATQLKPNGYKTHLFEKSRGPGGRMSTRNGDHWSADHGAQYFTARDPLFVEELNTWIQRGVAATWHPRLKVYEDRQWRESASPQNRYVGVPAMNSFGKKLAKNLYVTYGQTIDQIARNDGKWILHSIEEGSINEQFDWLILAIPAPQARCRSARTTFAERRLALRTQALLDYLTRRSPSTVKCESVARHPCRT